MTAWQKEEIEVESGERVSAQMPVIVSASRSTDRPGDPLFGIPDRWESGDYRKDKGQRAACGCIMSKDIGEYDTCPHLCHYCYANANNAAALTNWRRHQDNHHAETIISG